MATLDQQSLDGLLIHLDPDRERAGEKYETLRQKLIKFFAWNRCAWPEDYADETIDRVARRIKRGEKIGNISSYCLGVARLVLKECWRKQEKAREREDDQPLIEAPEENSEAPDPRLGCLRQCLEKLPPEDRRLVTQYYQGERAEKIKKRKELAARLKLTLNALRIRAHRLRLDLETCVKDCLQTSGLIEIDLFS